MRMPLIIGLPGVGKSEINAILSTQLNAPIISTDEEFRRYRAVPINDNNPDWPIITKFLVQVYHDFVSSEKMDKKTFDALLEKCLLDPKDPKRRNSFYPSDTARSFGEDVFRTFEWIMNRELNNSGAFDGKIVDISSSAALYKQNHDIFTPDKYKIFHLVADPDVIVDNLVEGFRRHQKLSAEAGQLVPIRGAYDKVARDAVAAAGGDDSDEVVRPALAALSQSHHWRLEHFNAMAHATVERKPGMSFASVALQMSLEL
ncbi:MAG: hypothetical protein DI551_11390 [Micavibrio aeruginosavorus]|uniref:Uncharacterized protein n=1 Tax=Micavibrio aeruginosavorus TaxID=349221 RepID=A0A2W5MRK1_9BACT|nr:MAG: hypothetical protein DI551_11390 [Micavibrio aeruginosavorus]